MPKAPFSFILLNNNLQGTKGENFLLKMRFEGEEIPADAFVVFEGSKHRLKKEEAQFKLLLKNPQEDLVFQFWANGFYSESMTLNIVPKPIIKSFSTQINYPSYTKMTDDYIINKGNLRVPEGSEIRWNFETERWNDRSSIGNRLE